MLHRPMAIAFAFAVVGAAILGARPGLGGWWPVLVGSTLTAAMTGIVTSLVQFLPARLFVPFTIAAGLVVALLVSVVLAVLGPIWIGPVAGRVAVVWALATVGGLVISRSAGLRFPRTGRREGE